MKNIGIDLHVHLDGSIPLSTAEELFRSLDIKLSEEMLRSLGTTNKQLSQSELRKGMEAPASCSDLNEYLSVFELPLQLMQSREGIEAVSYAFHRELDLQGVMYAEPRFALSLLTRQGLSQEEALLSALKGRDRYFAENPSSRLNTGFLICAMRGEGKAHQAANAESFEIAAAYYGKGVLGVDLAGAEGLFPTANYKELFKYAEENGLPFTIHAGEAAGPDSIREALAFRPMRIGHGVRAVEDAALMQELSELQIALELCPTSNIQTCIFRDISEFPLKQLMEQGIRLTINTDNMTVSNTDISREFKLLREYCGMDEKMEQQLLLNAADSIFMGDNEKNRLKTELLKTFSE